MSPALHKILFIIYLMFSGMYAQAQQHKNYLFTRYARANGLASDKCHAVVQDKQGYIWIATDQGLQRFDGKRFLTFRNSPGNPASIPSNGISRLLVDKKDRLWLIAYDNKIGIFNKSNFSYSASKVVVPEAFRKNNMFRFVEDHNGTLHVQINGYGVITYNEEKNEFAASHNLIRLPGGANIMDIHDAGVKGKYLVSVKGGFDIYNSNTAQWTDRNSNLLLKNINRLINQENALGPGHFLIDSKGRTWCDFWLAEKKGEGPQVLCYDPSTENLNFFKESIDKAAKEYHTIDGILEQKNGDIWIYGSSLFAKLNESKKIFEDCRNESLTINGIKLETIFNLFEDRDGNIWMSGTNGLFMFNPGRQVFNHIANRRAGQDKTFTNSVEAVIQSKTEQKTIYASTWSAGIFCYDSNFNAIPNPIIPTAQDNMGFAGWDMHERANGEIWVAVQSGSLRIYSPQLKKTTQLKLSVFENRTVRQVIEDSSGNMWMGTQYGAIIKCTGANWKDTAGAFKIVQRLNGRITKMVADRAGFVWVCTDRFGLYKLNIADGSIAAHYDELGPEGERLQIAGANDVLLLNDSIALIASGSLNILNKNTNKIKFVDPSSLYPVSSLANILKDPKGYIWLAFADGLARMDYYKNIFLFFATEDGILNNHFQINAATHLRDGRILLGTSTNLLVFDPAKVKISEKAVPVTLSGFILGDRPLHADSLMKLKKISLPYYENSFTIDLTTFSFHEDYAIFYSMEGLDEKWVNAKDNRVVFNRLPPGTYVFQAKSSSATGAESDSIMRIQIEIVPPFWKTWWFYGILVLSALTVFYLADRERLNRLRETQKIRTDISLSLHHDVNTTLNNINLLSEMARMKADKDVKKAKELIDQISAKSNDMMIAMDDMLWVIDPANDSMEKTILRMKEFIDSLQNRHQAEIEIHIDKKLTHLKPDMKQRHGFFFIFKTALKCMVQYSGAKKTLINIDLQKNGICLIILSRSPILKQADTNTCITDMKTQAAEIQAELDIQNTASESSIILLMPVS